MPALASSAIDMPTPAGLVQYEALAEHSWTMWSARRIFSPLVDEEDGSGVVREAEPCAIRRQSFLGGDCRVARRVCILGSAQTPTPLPTISLSQNIVKLRARIVVRLWAHSTVVHAKHGWMSWLFFYLRFCGEKRANKMYERCVGLCLVLHYSAYLSGLQIDRA